MMRVSSHKDVLMRQWTKLSDGACRKYVVGAQFIEAGFKIKTTKKETEVYRSETLWLGFLSFGKISTLPTSAFYGHRSNERTTKTHEYFAKQDGYRKCNYTKTDHKDRFRVSFVLLCVLPFANLLLVQWDRILSLLLPLLHHVFHHLTRASPFTLPSLHVWTIIDFILIKMYVNVLFVKLHLVKH